MNIFMIHNSDSKIGIIGKPHSNLTTFYYNSLETHRNKNGNNNIIIEKPLNQILSECYVIFCCIDIGTLDNGSYNHSKIDNFIDFLCDYCPKDEKIIIINTIVMPEYCSNIQQRLNNSKVKAKIIYNPDFFLIGYDNYNDKSDLTISRIINIFNYYFHSEFNNYIIKSLFETEINVLSTISLNWFIYNYNNMINNLLISKGYYHENHQNHQNHEYNYNESLLSIRANKAFYSYSKNNGFNFKSCYISDEYYKNHLLFEYNEKKKEKEPIELIFDNDKYHKLKLALMLATKAKKKVIISDTKSNINKLKNKYGDLFEYKELI